jgi:hypothetical protein
LAPENKERQSLSSTTILQKADKFNSCIIYEKSKVLIRILARKNTFEREAVQSMASTSSKAYDAELENFDQSMRIGNDQYLNYKWHAGGADAGFGYQDVINFKRAQNPRSGHHCVMCGDKKAIIPSQNKDVCKTCDTGFWVIKATQIVVKFCKG